MHEPSTTCRSAPLPPSSSEAAAGLVPTHDDRLVSAALNAHLDPGSCQWHILPCVAPGCASSIRVGRDEATLRILRYDVQAALAVLGAAVGMVGLMAAMLYYASREAPGPSEFAGLSKDAGAPVKPRDVVEAARRAGFPRRTLYRARRALAGRIVDEGSSSRDPGKRWVSIVSPKSHSQP